MSYRSHNPPAPLLFGYDTARDFTLEPGVQGGRRFGLL